MDAPSPSSLREKTKVFVHFASTMTLYGERGQPTVRRGSKSQLPKVSPWILMTCTAILCY